MSADPDELYTLRNLYWLGHYQLAINEANSLGKLSQNLLIEKDEFVYRSYLALGQYNILTSEIKDNESTPLSLKCIKLLCNYIMCNNKTVDTSAEKQQIIVTLLGYEAEAAKTNCKAFYIVYATILLYEDNNKDALKQVFYSNTLEHQALSIQILLRMNRVDLANNKLKEMKISAEEHALTRIAAAWIAYVEGDKTKLQNAVYTYEELIDKYSASAQLLNGQAIGEMHLGNYAAAESLLNDALSKGTAAVDGDSLANLIVVQQHLQRPIELVNRTISQLTLKSPNHPMISSLQNFDSAFDRVAGVA